MKHLLKRYKLGHPSLAQACQNMDVDTVGQAQGPRHGQDDGSPTDGHIWSNK